MRVPLLAAVALVVVTTTACGGGAPADEPSPAWSLDGRVLVLAAPGEDLRAAEAQADVDGVEQMLQSFRWEAMPYFGPDVTVRSEVILDPGLVGEEGGQPTPGLCDHTSQTVVLNRELWRSYGEDEREVVLFHELGHCELARRHTHGLRADGGPVSLMNRNAVADAEAYVRNREFYVRELFTTKSPPARFIRGEGLRRTPPQGTPSRGDPGPGGEPPGPP